MKNKTIKLATLLALSALTVVSCKKDDPKPNVTSDPNVITANTTWTADEVHELNGRIVVAAGATLTIEPGTVIKAAPGTEANASALVIAKGGKIDAQGTAQLPIIFTAKADAITPADVAAGNLKGSLTSTDNGYWGGLIVLGDAPVSVKGNQISAQIEGIPATDANGSYGGNNVSDNSGVIKYVSVRHGGVNIGANNEINGITFGGVGNGTVVENIEIVGNQDDGIEFFGGSVNVKNAVVWNNGDDGMDTDQDWTGTVDNFYVITSAGHAFELDGPEGTLASAGNFTFKNGTVIASADGRQVDKLIDIDPNTNGTLENIQFLYVESNQVIEGNTINGEATPVLYNNIYLDVEDAVSNYLEVKQDDPSTTDEDETKVTTFTDGSAVSAGTGYGADKSVFATWAWSYEAM